jgi:phosphoserine phosphatase
MLSVVGHPVAVNPDARLARLARAYAWPIVSLEAAPGPRLGKGTSLERST